MYVKIRGSRKDTRKLSLADYFQAGGNCVEHYEKITGREVDFNKWTKSELKSFAEYLQALGRRIEVDGKTKGDYIEAIKVVVKAA